MRISVVIPVYDMPNGDFFLKRCLDSLEKQKFKDFEVVITQEGMWAENHNAGIRKAKGEIIKFLHMDDYLFEDSLLKISDNFKNGWLVTGCIHDNGHLFNPHFPIYNPDIVKGKNTIGGPSVLAIENKKPLLFDEKLTWLVDCDYYKKLYDKYGEPIILDDLIVAIGIHNGQATNLIPDYIKLNEQIYMERKFK